MPSPLRRACVIGHPVAHSRSPLIHGHWLRELRIAGAYERADVTPEAFPEFITHLAAHGFVGANVTVPHKEAAHRLVARRDANAEAIGAVNTVWFEGDTLVGGNSDVHGFLANLDELAPGWDAAPGHAVVLGAGGAARAAVFGLLGRNLRVTIANRTAARADELARHFGGRPDTCSFGDLAASLRTATLLVNCTSLGMHGKPPLDIDVGPLASGAVVCDIVYVPLVTPLLAAAAARGHRTVDGLGMLLHQAGFGFEKWFGTAPTVTRALRAEIEADLYGPAQASSGSR